MKVALVDFVLLLFSFILFYGSSINHVVKILGIVDPPSWSLLLNKAYVIKWSFD